MRMPILSHLDIRLPGSLRNSARPSARRAGRTELFYIMFAVLSRLSYSTAPIRLNGQ